MINRTEVCMHSINIDIDYPASHFLFLQQIIVKPLNDIFFSSNFTKLKKIRST